MTPAEVDGRKLLERYTLLQNYPNPFNPFTTIEYTLPKRSHVVLNVFDMLGKNIVTLFDGNEEMGEYSVKVDGTNLASGTYYYRFAADDFVQIKKFVVLK
jgi:hypothetical protein